MWVSVAGFRLQKIDTTIRGEKETIDVDHLVHVESSGLELVWV